MSLSQNAQQAINEVIRTCIDMGINVSPITANKGRWNYYILGKNLILENHNNNTYTESGFLTTKWDVKNIHLKLGWNKMYGNKKKINRYYFDSKGADRDEIRRFLQIAKDYEGD